MSQSLDPPALMKIKCIVYLKRQFLKNYIVIISEDPLFYIYKVGPQTQTANAFWQKVLKMYA